MSSGAEPPIRRLVLATSAYSWLRGGHEAVLDLVAAAEIVIVPVTVLGELEAGFELGGRQRENRATLADFLSSRSSPSGAPPPTPPAATASSSRTFGGRGRPSRSTTSAIS